MQDFINPKSMLTPGVAGALMMFLVNGIVGQFPEFSPRYVGLLFSFLIGAAIFASEALAQSVLMIKGTFWIVNSLIIFVVGFGTSHLANNATTRIAAYPEPPAIAFQWISTAYAQNDTSTGAARGGLATSETTPDLSGGTGRPSLGEKLNKARQENSILRKRIEELNRANRAIVSKTKSENENTFFRKW